MIHASEQLQLGNYWNYTQSVINGQFPDGSNHFRQFVALYSYTSVILHLD